MRICLVSPFPPPYGGVAHWTTLIHHSAQTSEGIDLIQVNTIPRWRAIDDVSVWKRALGGGTQLFRDYFFFIAALLKRPDAVHLTSSADLGLLRDLIICATARLFYVPVCYHLHFGRVPQIAKENTIEWYILTLALKLANIVVSITPQTAETITRQLPGVCVEYIPNPITYVDISNSIKNISENKQVLFLGWIIPAKGVDELVQAWAEIDPEGWELVLIGPGKTTYQQELIDRYNPNSLKFIGEVQHDQAMQLLAQCDIFVLPSYTEGFPNVILEAMIYGKPIIATAVGAVPDMLSENCGLLINPQDVEGLKNALLKLIKNQDLRNHLGAKSRQKALQSYSIDKVFTQYINVWESLRNKKLSGQMFQSREIH